MKTKINALVVSLFFLATLSSCTTYLTPAILGNNMGYLPKAMGADSIKTLTHVSASLAGSISPDADVNFTLGMANLSRSHTFKTGNISYGIFGYAGTSAYKRPNDNTATQSNDYLPSFRKSINGVGFRLSTGLHHTAANGNTDFRFINFENALSFEGGAYTKFRQEVYDSKLPDYVAVTNRKVLWTTGLSTEVIWRSNNDHDIRHAFRLFIGGTPNFVDSFRSGTNAANDIYGRNSAGWVFSYFLNINRFSLSYELADNVNYAQKVSFGYSFH